MGVAGRASHSPDYRAAPAPPLVTAAMSENLYDLLAGRFPADRGKPCFLLPDGAAIGLPKP